MGKEAVHKGVSYLVVMGLLMSLCFVGTAPVRAAGDGGKKYLAVFTAKYEYNMGVEHAQFPSGKYTHNIRTDVLYYAVSEDGDSYSVLNHSKPVLYPLGRVQIAAPSLFRKADGTYGLIAATADASAKIFLSDTEDLVTYTGDRTVSLASGGVKVMEPSAAYNESEEKYDVYWTGNDGARYHAETTDFKSFSNQEKTDYARQKAGISLPGFADEDGAFVFEIEDSEYQKVMNRYGEIRAVSVDGLAREAAEGSRVELPDRLDVSYSDGSKTEMGVEWELADSPLDREAAKAGTYHIQGRLKGTTEYRSPVGEFRADPFILYNSEDGYYYMTGSYMQKDLKNAYDYVVIRRAKTINELPDAEEVKIFSGTAKAEAGVKVSPDYWAPEIHKIGGKYRILVQGTVDSKSRQCILTCEGDLMNPDEWSYTGYIGDTTDGQAIGPFDTTYFEHEGQGYYITQHTTGGSKLDITTVDPSDPTTPTGPHVSIAVPDRAYETNVGTGQSILEGPAAIAHDGKVYVTYSGATIDMHYCTNLVYADLDSDLMNPESWTKLQEPLLTTADLTETVKEFSLDNPNGEYKGLMGPGHSNFTVDENGNPLLVFHARDWSESYAAGNDKYGLSDPGRHAYVKCIHFGADGLPVLNMTAEQILPEELRNVTMTIQVKGGAQATAAPVPTEPGPAVPVSTEPGAAAPVPTEPGLAAAPGSSTDKPSQASSPAKENLKKDSKGKMFVSGKIRYRITKTAGKGKGTAAVAGTVSKNQKVLTVPGTVSYGGEKYEVTSIGKKAFQGCKALKKITVKTKKLTEVAKNAFLGCGNGLKVKVPGVKKKNYKKLFSKCSVKVRII